MSTTQVYRPQNAGHTQGRAAAELVFVSGPTELINYENEQYYSFALTIIIQTPNNKNLWGVFQARTTNIHQGIMSNEIFQSQPW